MSRKDAPKKWPYTWDLHQRALTFARGYPDRVQQAEDLIQKAPVNDGQPRGTGTSDPVAVSAERRETFLEEIHIVEAALEKIPEKYRDIVLRNVVEGVPAYAFKAKDESAPSDSTIYDWRITFLSWIVVLAGWDVHWSLLPKDEDANI